MKSLKLALAAGSLLLLSLTFTALGQVQTNTAQAQNAGDNPLYHITINVVERSTTAINYRNRSGSTTIDFKGTPMFPKANGEASVETKKGYTEIDAEFHDLEPATRFGPEYLTYVLWAISPE